MRNPVVVGSGAYRSAPTCVGCGKAIDAQRAAFSGDGLLCAVCENAELRPAAVYSGHLRGLLRVSASILSTALLFFFAVLTVGLVRMATAPEREARETHLEVPPPGRETSAVEPDDAPFDYYYVNEAFPSAGY